MSSEQEPVAESAIDQGSIEERRAKALERLVEGHQAVKRSLEGLDAEDAFLGSRWSVWEVLKHLDAENFVGALEKIAAGEATMLPPFSTREDQLKKDIAHLDETHERFKSLVQGLTSEQLAQPVTPPNPHNSYPGLSLLELVERTSGHAATHSRQIEETRKYVEAFLSRERAVNIVGLGAGSRKEMSDRIAANVKDLLNYADYVVGEPAALEIVRPLMRGVELVLRPDNGDEVMSRLGREVKAGIWVVVCCLDDPNEAGNATVALAKKHAETVVIHPVPSE